jgi:hypothetical protein
LGIIVSAILVNNEGIDWNPRIGIKLRPLAASPGEAGRLNPG